MRKLLQTREDFLVTGSLRSGFFAEKGNFPPRFKHGTLDFRQRGEPLLMRRRLQFRQGDEFLLQPIHSNLPVLNQYVSVAFDQLIELLVAVEKAYDEIVHDEEGCRADNATRYRIVITDDSVLHGVR